MSTRKTLITVITGPPLFKLYIYIYIDNAAVCEKAKGFEKYKINLLIFCQALPEDYFCSPGKGWEKAFREAMEGGMS